MLDGHGAEVRRRLERFTPEEIAAHPTLALAAAAQHLATGERDLVEHWTAAAQSRLNGSGPESLYAGVETMRAAVARNGIDTMVSDAARAYERSSDDSPWRSLCCLLRGVGEHLQGNAAPARAHLEEGARRGAIAAPSVQSLCLAQLALLAIDDGDWEQGPLLAARARAQVDRVGLEGNPTAALVFAVSALVRAHRERVEDAQADRRRAVELLTGLVDYVPWYDAEARVVLARAALRLGDVTGTRTLLGEASRALSHDPAASVLCGWVDELRDQVEAFALTELVGPSVVDDRGVARPDADADPPLVPRDGSAAARLRQHGKDARECDLPQAGRLLAIRGRCPRAQHRAARRVASARPRRSGAGSRTRRADGRRRWHRRTAASRILTRFA